MPLRYISNFFRSLELPLINTKLYIELNWNKFCVINDSAGVISFQITKAELCAPFVTLNPENNKKLSDLLRKVFERSVFWNEYESKIQTVTIGNAVQNIETKRIVLDSSYQGVSRLFVAVYDTTSVKTNTQDNNKRYYLPRVDNKDYNVLIYGRTFYEQNINDTIKIMMKLEKLH